MQLPDSASVERTAARDAARSRQIAKQTPGVKHTVAIAGQSILLNANAPNFGAMYVMLDDFHDRARPELSGRRDRGAACKPSLQDEISDGVVNVFGAPPVEGLGTAGGFKIMIEDRGDTRPARRCKTSPTRSSPTASDTAGLQGLFTSFRANTPWLYPRHRPRRRPRRWACR